VYVDTGGSESARNAVKMSRSEEDLRGKFNWFEKLLLFLAIPIIFVYVLMIIFGDDEQ